MGRRRGGQHRPDAAVGSAVRRGPGPAVPEGRGDRARVRHDGRRQPVRATRAAGVLPDRDRSAEQQDANASRRARPDPDRARRGHRRDRARGAVKLVFGVPGRGAVTHRGRQLFAAAFDLMDAKLREIYLGSEGGASLAAGADD